MAENSTYFIGYTMTLEGYSGDGPHVMGLRIEDAINEPYQLHIHANLIVDPGETSDKTAAEGVKKYLGKNVKLEWLKDDLPETKEVMHGRVISVVRRVGGFRGNPRPLYDFVVAPAFHMLRYHGDQPRAWHNVPYLDVLKEVLTKELGAYGRSIEIKAPPGDPIQFINWPAGMTAYDFVQRLVHLSGINLFFRQPPGGPEVLVLGDLNDHFIPGNQEGGGPIPIGSDTNEDAKLGQWLRTVDADGEERRYTMRYKGYDAHKAPTLLLNEFDEPDPDQPPATVHYHWMGVRPEDSGTPEKPLNVAAKLEGDRSLSERHAVRGQTQILGMLAGRVFEVQGERGKDIRKYVVASATHQTGEFANSLEAEVKLIPFETPEGAPIKVRLGADDRRRETGVALARIVALEHPAVDADSKLWCRLRFLWDESEVERTAYFPVVQPMAGKFFGSQWIPRVDDVVVVGFQQGNPDCPVILGCVYDNDQPPPYLGPPERSAQLGRKNPEEALLWLGWNHLSVVPGSEEPSANFSMMATFVAEGKELFYFHAPKDWQVDVEENATYKIGKSREETVGENWKLDVTGTSDETVKGKRTETYEAGVKTKVEGEYHECTHGGTRTIHAEKGNCEIKSTEAVLIVAPDINCSESDPGGCAGGEGPATSAAFAVGNGRGELDGPQYVRLRSQDTRIETKTESVEVSTPGSIDIDAGSRTTIATKDTRVALDPQSVAVEAAKTEITDRAQGNVTLEGGRFIVDVPQGITLRCNGTELTLSPEGVFINGRQLIVNTDTTEINTERFDVTGEGPES